VMAEYTRRLDAAGEHAYLETDKPENVALYGRFGFEVLEETPAGTYYRAGDGTYFAVTRSSGAASGTHTQMGFRVADIVAEVAQLRDRGVVFEEYETPKTVDGIATLPVGRSAWFKDPDGNTEAARADRRLT